MDNTEDHKYFLFLSSKKISFTVLNSQNQFFFNKETIINDVSIEESFDTLKNFLDQNILEIEKNLKSYVKEVFIIIYHNSFLNVDMSFNYNFKQKDFTTNHFTNSLIDLKNNFKKTIIDYEISHMIINKFIIDEKIYTFMPNNIDFDNLFLELKFICIKNDTILNFKKILSKYQISLGKVLSFNYISKFKSSKNESIFNLADKILGGLNQNEIFLINKSKKNKGFFEKFFNFFS